MIKNNTRGIINNTNSPYVKLKSIDLGECQWTEGFWAEKWKQAEKVMVPYMGNLLKGDVGHGLNNFKTNGWKPACISMQLIKMRILSMIWTKSLIL